MSFDLALAGGNNQASSFYIYDSTNSKAILELIQNAAGNYTAWSVNGKSLTYSGKSANCTYNIAVKNGTVYFSITDGATKKFDKEIIATGVSGLGKMVFNTKRYYAGMTIDNVLVRELQADDVPAAEPFNYSVTAVDEEDNVIKELTNGSATEPLGYAHPIIISNGGNYYIAKNTSSFNNAISDSNHDIKIVYVKNDNIVAYAEAETSTKSTEGNYSNGSVGYVATQNYTNRGIGLGTLQPGKYQMVVNITANNTRNVALRNSSFYTTAEVDNILCEATSNGMNTKDFEVLVPTPVLVNGKNSGTKSNQSADFDYVYIVKTGEASLDVTLNGEGLATFSAAFPTQITGAKAYIAAMNAEGDKLVCTEIADGLVPAGEGVILNGEAGASVTATAVAEAPAVADNELAATTKADGSLATFESSLVLSGKTFMTYNGAAFAANKAYLPYVASGAKFSIVFVDDDATAATVVEAKAETKVVKFMKNGQLLIKTANGIVNAAGAQVK